MIKGMGVSQGRVTGKVKIVHSIKNSTDFTKGDILVTRMTDPTMVPMMMKAAGIICEIGGMTSHPSIVSRELGIPCIVAVADAMQLLKDGETISMDGETGEIRDE